MHEHTRTRVVICTMVFAVSLGLLVVGMGSGSFPSAGATGRTWSIQSITHAGADGVNNKPKAISCTSATHCIVVGQYWNGTVNATLVEQWDGSNWTIMPSPNSAGIENDLTDVSCADESHCVAVGTYRDGSNGKELVLIWDGSAWSLSAGIDLGVTSTSIRSVDCSSPTFCVAVGYGYAPSFYSTLAQYWDGASWNLMSTPDPGGFDERNALSDISCASPSSCVATAGYLNGSNFERMFMTWDGSTWTLGPSLGTGSLVGLSCADATTCMAVGSAWDGTRTSSIAAEWNSGTGTPVAIPDANAFNQDLRRISCTAPTDCVAVGTYGSDLDLFHYQLVQVWDGTSWTIATTPSPAPDPSQPDIRTYDVECVSSTVCFVVGMFYDTVSWNGYVMISSDPTPPTTPTTPTTEPVSSSTTSTEPNNPIVPNFTG